MPSGRPRRGGLLCPARMNPGITYTEPILAIWFLLAVLGWVRLRRRGRYGALVAAFFLLFLASLARGRLAFFAALEARYPILPLASEPVEAIVVLSESVEPAHYERPFVPPRSGTVERCR